MNKKKITAKQFLDANKEAVEELNPFGRVLLFGRLALSIVVFLLCILGITGVMSTNTAVPIALSIMAVMMLLYGINYIRLKKPIAIFYLFMTAFLIAFVVIFELALKN